MASIIRSTMIFLKSNTGSARNFLNSPSITPTYPVASSMASMGTRSLAVAIPNLIFPMSATAAILRSLTVADLTQSDGSIGTVSISRVGLKAKVYEGATDSSMSKGAGHYEGSGLYFGNVALFGHNRGNHPYFGKLKNVKVGDTVKYETNQGTKTYEVTFVGKISSTDYSYTNEMGDNRITLITCVANQPSLRLCVQAVEIH